LFKKIEVLIDVPLIAREKREMRKNNLEEIEFVVIVLPLGLLL